MALKEREGTTERQGCRLTALRQVCICENIWSSYFIYST